MTPRSHDVTHQELSDEEALAKAEFGMPRGVREVEAMVRRAETNEDIARMERLPENDHHLNGLKYVSIPYETMFLPCFYHVFRCF